jgi:PD-(D/E)XK nuclease superfamily
MISWSHSVLESFETCQWRHYLTKVTKEVSDPPGEAMMRGRVVHKAFEDRIKHHAPLSEALAKHEPIVARLEALGGRMEAETQMALNMNYRQVPWFGKGPNTPWVRAVTDVSVFKGTKAFVGDWKTGKRKTDSAQLKLSAAVIFAVHPYLEEIRNSFIWLDHPVPEERFTSATFHKSEASALWREFLPRVARLEAAHAQNQWPKRPSGLCRAHCPVPRSKCEHSGV